MVRLAVKSQRTTVNSSRHRCIIFPVQVNLAIGLCCSLIWHHPFETNENRRFHTFVANRVPVIREATDVTQWKHIGTTLNLADEASRWLSAEDFLVGKQWLEGPEFLLYKTEDWPKSSIDQLCISVYDPEVKRDIIVNTSICKDSVCATSKLLHYFIWTKLKASVAWFLKFKDVLMEIRRQRKSI